MTVSQTFSAWRFVALASALALVNCSSAMGQEAAETWSTLLSFDKAGEASGETEKDEEPIEQVGYDAGESVSPGVWEQVDAMRSQIARQQLQIDQLRGNGRSGQDDRAGGLFATYESVVVQPTQSNATGLIVETDDGYTHVGFPWHLEYSPRVQFGREALGNNLGWRMRYWQFRHSDSFQANNANGLIPTGYEATVGFLSEDGDITTGLGFITEGEFRSSVRADVIDWELQRKVSGPLDFYAGLRYAKLSQGYNAVTDQGIVDSYSEFRGLGPTAALRLTHVLPYDKLQLFANLRGSMLFGAKEFSAVDDVNNRQRQSVGEVNLRSGDDFADTLATNAELQLGIRCEVSSNIALSVAVESQYYGNVGGANPTGVFTGRDSGLAGDSPLDDSLSFLGLTVGSEIRW
ncbi:MAG: Lpg1974 family pore-forming outer membrane protein [Rubripirellula sp.]